MSNFFQSKKYEDAIEGADQLPEEEVYKLIIAAHSEGDARATYSLATWNLHGLTNLVEVDHRTAFGLLTSINDKCIAEAIFDLAYCYDTGTGTRKNQRLAFKYYMQAALLGDRESSVQISEFYREGALVPYDKYLSKAWLDRSQCDETKISPPYRVSLAK